VIESTSEDPDGADQLEFALAVVISGLERMLT
jgi:hypothetical protein